ncbi:t-SNARE affecting a late Golgi compartment protein 2 [Oleoguttula sp. CCFEE 5521]
MSTAHNLGAWRDRTNLFISYRQSYAHHPAKRPRYNGPTGDFDSESAGLLNTNDGDAVIEMDVLPPRWLDIQDEIAQHLTDVSTRMRRLDQMHAKHVLPGFDDESVKAKEEREIEALTQEITRGFTSCQVAIRRVDKLVAEQARTQQSRGGLTKEDETMARNLKMSLAARVGEVSTTFRKKQTAYLKKLRSLNGLPSTLDSRSATPSLAANPYTDPAMQDSELDRSSAQSTLLQTAQVRRRTGLQDSAIEQREREIESIAQGVIDLSNMFQELQTMVIDQGSLLDRIDYNVERTAEHVKAADKELTVATGYQKKSTKRKVLLLLILLVVGMLILLMVKPRSRGSAVAAPPSEVPKPPEELPPRSVMEERVVKRHLEWKQRRRRVGNGSSVMIV